MAGSWTALPGSSSPRGLSPAGRAFAGPLPGVLAHGSGHTPQNTSASFQNGPSEAWWQAQSQQRSVTVPRHIIERLRAVHLAQLDELSRLRVQVGQTRSWPLRHHQILDRLRESKRQEAELSTKVAVATEEVTQNHDSVNLMRYNCVDLEAQLRAAEAREAQLEERFAQRATRASEAEQGAIMSMEVSIVGIDLNELHDLEAVRLITRPVREAAAQTLGLARAASSCSLSEGVGRLALHFRLPPDLRTSPDRFRTFKKHFVEAKQSGEFRARLEESLLELEDEFGTRVAVRSVSQPVLLDGAKITVPEGAGAMGMVPEGHPPSLVTLWQVQPGSWSQKAGIQSGDTLLWLNDQPVTEIDVRVLADRMRNRRPLSMYIARPPGAHTTRAKEEAAAKQIQTAFRKKLARERGRDQMHRINLAQRTRDKERQAAAAAAAAQRKKQATDSLDPRKLDKLDRMSNRPGIGRDNGDPRKNANLAGVDDILADLGEYLDQNDEIELEYVRFELETSERKLGIRTQGDPPDAPVRVADITRGAWADQNEIEVGDEVLSINGISLSRMPFEDFNKALKTRPLKMEFQRAVPASAAFDAKRNAAATKIQARLRGSMARTKRDRLAEARDAELEENSRRKRAAQAANAEEDRWIDYNVKPSVKQMGWIPAGMAPDRMIVESVVDGSWAEHLGVQVGDELIRIGGKEVHQLNQKSLTKLMKERPLDLQFYRWGDVVGDEVPAYDGGDDDLDDLLGNLDAALGAKRGAKKGGSTKLKVTADKNVKKLGFVPSAMPPDPVIVSFVEPGSWAESSGVQPNDVLVSAQGVKTSEMDENMLVDFMQERPLDLTFRQSSQRGTGYGDEGDADEEDAPDYGAPRSKKNKKRAKGADARPGGEASQFQATADDSVQYLGITPSAMPPDYVYVHLVESGLWADQNGVAVGDAIVALNGIPIEQMNSRQFTKLMRERPLTFTFEQGSGQPQGTGEAQGLGGKNGTMFELTAEKGVETLGFTPTGVPPNEEVIINQIAPNSWSEKHGLLERIDSLVAVDGVQVAQMNSKQLTKAMRKRPVRLTFLRSEGPPPGPPRSGWADAQDHFQDGDFNAGLDEGGDGDGGEEFEVTAYEEDGDWLGWNPTGFPPDMIFIADVEAESWAYNKYLEVDDQLLKVNGLAVADMDEKSLKRAMRERPLTMTFWRNAQINTDFPGGFDTFENSNKEKKKKKGKKGKKTKKDGDDDSDTLVEKTLEALGLDEDSDDPAVQAARKKARKSKKATVSADKNVDDLGFSPSGYPPDDVFIEAVLPYGFADSKKLKVGDQLIAVNKIDLKELNKQDLKKLMKERPIQLTFERKKTGRTPR